MPREPLSAAGNAATSASTAVQTGAILFGIDDPRLAALAAVAWAVVAGAIGKVSRDELHLEKSGAKTMSPAVRLLWTIGSALG